VGVKGGQRLRLTTLPPYVSRLSRENVGSSSSYNPMGLHGLLQAFLYLGGRMGDRLMDKMREMYGTVYCPPTEVYFNLPKREVHLNNLYDTYSAYRTMYHPIQI
jgi:hypothetical protein